MITLEWFTDLVSRMSRQTLTTMGKRAGLKPFSRQGTWGFHNAAGEELTLEQAYEVLQGNPAGREWLAEMFEMPARLAAQADELSQERTQKLEASLSESYQFLVSDFGYDPPVRIVARIDDCTILGYRNTRAARQVEVSGISYGYGTHCEIRRLVDGEPGEYGAHSIAIWELQMVREPRIEREEQSEREGALRQNVALLKRHEDILRGTGWIDRDKIDRIVTRAWARRLGIRLGNRNEPTMLDLARNHAAFLVSAHGFTLEFDSGALSPHETLMWQELVYRRGPTTIRIANTDIRVVHEWSVELNGRRVSELQGDLDAWLVEVLRNVSQGL